MNTPHGYIAARGRRLAVNTRAGNPPHVVFLGGLRSDKEGTKALALEEWACRRGQAFTRFDYSGHGASSGRFEDGCISDWAEDARTVIKHEAADGPVLLIGSSMGGWVALLLARSMPDRITGLITIAAAPDFTEDSMLPSLSSEDAASLAKGNTIYLPSEYGDPLPVTPRLIEDGRHKLVLRNRMTAGFATRILHGTDDKDVSPAVSQRLFDHLEGGDIQLMLVKGADHRFSDDKCLALLVSVLDAMLAHNGTAAGA